MAQDAVHGRATQREDDTMHMVIGGNRYTATEAEIEKVRSAIVGASKSNEAVEVGFTDSDGDGVVVLWTPGVPFAVHSWDQPGASELNLPEIPRMPPMGFNR